MKTHKPMTEEQKIKAIMKERGVDRETAGEMLCLEEGFEEDGIKFTWDEEKGCFVGKDKDGQTICANI
jgi:hypothetical protein